MIPLDREPALSTTVATPTLARPEDAGGPQDPVPVPRSEATPPMVGTGWRRTPRGTRPLHRGRQARWSAR
jgi:hypothetical protein